MWQNWPAKKHRHRLYIVQLFMQLLIHWQRNWRMCFSFMAVHCNVTNSTWTWKSISIAARYNDMRVMNHCLVIVETKSRIYSQYLQNGKNKFVLDKKKWLIKYRNHTVNRVGKPKKHLALRPIALTCIFLSITCRLRHDSYSNVALSSVSCMIWRDCQVQLKFIIPRCPCL